MMREKVYLLFFFILILSTEMTLGKNGTKIKLAQGLKKRNYSIKQSSDGRTKRSVNIDDIKTYSSNIGTDFGMQFNDLERNEENLKKFVTDTEPFWGTRGRRDSSEENFIGRNLVNPIISKDNRCFGINCKDCSKTVKNLNDIKEFSNEKREEVGSPFWGNRGRRDSDETDNDDHDSQAPFWGIRGRRQENDPFWGTRGRRQDDSPFWGNRGRREDLPFWGQRGRREEAESFWANRGRRVDDDPFWGTRGRRQESEPFWVNRVKKQGYNSFANDNAKERKDLKGYIRDAINIVEHNIENLASEIPLKSFWKNRGRASQLKFMFNGGRLKNQKPNSKLSNTHSFVNPSASRTMLDNRIYADEPHFILVERSSRSSSEDDPFFISRGKKKFVNFQLAEAARDRRGSVEELVKSVRNDPYYIARGKKDLNKFLKLENSTDLREKLEKAKDLICSTLDLLTIKNESNNIKREVDDNDRDRRTILKKLTDQLQNDPYFVSRGKKNDKSRINDDNLEDFISKVSEKCY